MKQTFGGAGSTFFINHSQSKCCLRDKRQRGHQERSGTAPDCLITRFLFTGASAPPSAWATVTPAGFILCVTHIYACPGGSSSKEPGPRRQEGPIAVWRGQSFPRGHRRGDLVSLSYSLLPPRSFVHVHLTVCQGRFRRCRRTHASPLIGVTAETMAYTFWQRSCRFQSFFHCFGTFLSP